MSTGIQTRYLLPLLLFVALIVLFIYGLGHDPRKLPSALIGKPLPEFELAQLYDVESTFSKKDLLGDVSLINVWASWCVSCRYEHPILLDFARSSEIVLYGLNYKDAREDALRWLQQYGDPYQLIAFDPLGRTAIDFGLYGVPETYVMDKDGIVRYKHVGPISEQDLNETILPLIKKLRTTTI